MKQRTLLATALAAALSLGLAACDRGTTNPNAPGSPGTGNARESTAPSAGDSSSGRGSSGPAGALAHPGSSGGDAPSGTTGAGTAGATQPGTGLQGGLGANGSTTPGQATAATEGSGNRTSKSSVGNR